MTKRFGGSWAWVVCVLGVACGIDLPPVGPTDPKNKVLAAQTDFITNEYEGQARADSQTTYANGGSAGRSEASATDSAPAPSEDSAKAPSGRTGTVEEADIYRVDDNRLFYLNTYKGFIIYDLNDPAKPVQVSRLPVHGYPIEMFIDKNTVYALLRDALYVTEDISGLHFTRHNVSQLVSIDITDLKNPKVLKTFDIVGQLKEGVSRKIDNTVYVVSYQPQSYYYHRYPYSGTRTEQAWVYSYNVANPANPVEMDRLKIFEGGGEAMSSRNGDAYSSSNRYFTSVAISATANTLHVVENWSTYSYSNGGHTGCSSTYRSQNESVVSIVDISNPTGKIRLHSHFTAAGALTDQFKQSYQYDSATGKGTYLGIFARQEWVSSGCQSQVTVRNTLEAWDVTDGANPVRVSSIAFGKPNETVRGSTFDMDRKVAYAITARAIDPLYALSFADPTQLKILSEIDGLSGDMSVFRLIGGGKFLLGIGRDNTSTCTGFASNTTGWATNIAVSIIDVADLAKIRLVQRKCVTVKNATWVSSQLTWNLDQAHKMIGMNSDGRADVVSVPVSYYTPVNTESSWWWYRYQSAVGLMSYDLSKYDPSKDELNQSVLTNRATVTHENGEVRRSIVFTHKGATDRRMMVNLSDTHVSVTDIDELDAPAPKALIEVAPMHQRIFKFGDYVVDQVSEGTGTAYPPRGSEFRVRRAGRGLEDTAPLAAFGIGQVSQVVQWKNTLVLFRPDYGAWTSNRWSRWLATDVVVYDLSNPESPKLRGTTKLNSTYLYPWWAFDCFGGWGYWGNSESAADDNGLAQIVGNSSGGRDLQYIDLSDLDNPRLTLTPLAANARRDYVRYPYDGYASRHLELLPDASGSGFVVTRRERVGSFETQGARFGQYRYFVERWVSEAGKAPKFESSVNVPGQLLRTWVKAGQRHYLTRVNEFEQVLVSNYGTPYLTWKSDPRLNLLSLAAPGKARLDDTRVIEGASLSDMVGDGDTLALIVQPNTWAYAPIVDSATQDELRSDRLLLLDLSKGALHESFRGSLGTSSARLMGHVGTKLFVNLANDGVLVVDTTTLAKPVGQHFVRTLGYATHLVTAGGFAYIAAGNFGIFEVDLNAPSSILRL